MAKNKVIALLGNPNCGKTTLFNVLTGAKAKVGNWSGVTVEKKFAPLKSDKSISVVDLPGTYSLDGGSKDRQVVTEYFRDTPPDVVINIVDGLNLERNLYLTGELSALGIPFVIAVNMSDELEKQGAKLNIERLSQMFDAPVVPISALTGLNSDLLVKTTIFHHKKSSNLLEFSKLSVKQKYDFLSREISGIIVLKQTKRKTFAEKLDKWTTGKYSSLIIFFCVMTAIYFISIKLGGYLGGKIGLGVDELSRFLLLKLNSANAPEWITDLLCNAIVKGLGAVLTFLPQILLLFSLMSVLEDSGYMARVAFIFDGIFARLGLSGKSLIPIILSCGCTVTGLSATRTIESDSERKMTIFISPFIPCSAKSAVFGWLSSVFFGGSALVASSLYFLSFAVCILSGRILKNFKIFSSNGSAFFLEIPPYRKPSMRNVGYAVWQKIKEFTVKAGTVVFAVGVLSWFLQRFGIHGYVGNDVEKSFLYVIGNGIKYVFYPLGFGTWQVSVSLLSGALAKEAIIETLQIIGSDVTVMFGNTYAVYAFMAFIALSPPCIASIATAKRELGNKKLTLLMIAYETVVAYAVALIINLMGFLNALTNGLLFWAVVGIIIITLSALSVKRLVKRKCASCSNCKGDKRCQKKKPSTT